VEKGAFPWEQCIFPKETYVSNLFAIIIISILFSYNIATYRWKGFKESYNNGGNISIKIHMQKLQSNKISNTFVPQGNLSSFSLGDMIVP